jgi:hypothetical protein
MLLLASSFPLFSCGGIVEGYRVNRLHLMAATFILDFWD